MSRLKRTNPVITVVLKGYPRLSETFIAQELLALEGIYSSLLTDDAIIENDEIPELAV